MFPTYRETRSPPTESRHIQATTNDMEIAHIIWQFEKVLPIQLITVFNLAVITLRLFRAPVSILCHVLENSQLVCIGHWGLLKGNGRKVTALTKYLWSAHSHLPGPVWSKKRILPVLETVKQHQSTRLPLPSSLSPLLLSAAVRLRNTPTCLPFRGLRAEVTWVSSTKNIKYYSIPKTIYWHYLKCYFL